VGSRPASRSHVPVPHSPRVKAVEGARASASTRGRDQGHDFDNLDLLPADFTYRNMDLAPDAAKKPLGASPCSRRRATDYDVVFPDRPPGISPVSENVLQATDTLLVPLIRRRSRFEALPSSLSSSPPSRAPSCAARFLLHGRPT
jgi:cellulose biosynthesis protein BcsQ